MTPCLNGSSSSLLVLLIAVTVLPLCHAIQAIPQWEVGFALIDDKHDEFRIFNLDGLPVTWWSELGGRLVATGNRVGFTRTLATLGYTGCREKWSERR